jgi:tetratricopeptide (TPR) repeat protein
LANARLNNFQNAIADYSKSIQLKNDPGAYYLRGLMKVELKDYKGAIEDLDSAYEEKKTSQIYFFKREL